MPDETKGETPTAFIVLHSGAVCTAQDIVEHCRKHLAPYKTPRHIEFRDDLPRNSTGKILRRALKTPA
jgi:acyl-coenzyme A synthetase/AMP-(fatty) acid ligase